MNDYRPMYPEIICKELCDYVVDYLDSNLLCYMLDLGIDLSINDNYIIKKAFGDMIRFEHNNQINKLKIIFAMDCQLHANGKIKASLF